MKYEDNLTEAWPERFHGLNDTERAEAKRIIAANNFSDEDIACAESVNVRELLKFYQVKRRS